MSLFLNHICAEYSFSYTECAQHVAHLVLSMRGMALMLYFFTDIFWGGFTVFYCDITRDVHLCMKAAPYFLIAIAQPWDPQGAGPVFKLKTC